MNTSLGNFRDVTPYQPSLRAHCGSVLGAILMRQLDYWFIRYPQGFYKFLTACEHAKYREGDAWTEELCFSEYEFRKAFDAIGVRYSSKKALVHFINDYLDSHEDANEHAIEQALFQDKYYLSTFDTKTGETVYYRHHKKLDGLINRLNGQTDGTGDTQPTDSNREDVLLGPTLRNLISDLKKLKVRPEVSLGGYKETETTTRDHPETTTAKETTTISERPANTPQPDLAAAQVEKSFDVLVGQPSSLPTPQGEETKTPLSTRESAPDSTPSPMPASESFARREEGIHPLTAEITPPDSDAALAHSAQAASASPAVDLCLSTELTPGQQACVEALAKRFAPRYTHGEVALLATEISQTLLDPTAFSQAGSDFTRKYHTIQKSLRDGRHRPPSAVLTESVSAADRDRLALERALREMQGEAAQLARLRAGVAPENTTLAESLNAQEGACVLKIAELRTALHGPPSSNHADVTDRDARIETCPQGPRPRAVSALIHASPAGRCRPDAGSIDGCSSDNVGSQTHQALPDGRADCTDLNHGDKRNA